MIEFIIFDVLFLNVMYVNKYYTKNIKHVKTNSTSRE
jgi:hypothetical protein